MKNIEKYTWTELLFNVLIKVNNRAIKRLIGVGSIDFLKLDRKQMLYEHDTVLKLSKKEIEWIVNNLDLSKYDTVTKIFQEILSYETGKNKPISNKNRKNIIKNLENTLVNPPYSVILSIEERINWEKSFLGISLSCSPLDLIDKIYADTFISEINQGKSGKTKLLVELNKVNIIKTKNNEEMAFLSGSDTSGLLNDIVIFPKILTKYKNLIAENNCVVLFGESGQRGNFIIDKVKQA